MKSINKIRFLCFFHFRGNGAVVGILKIGNKRLFVYNHQGTVQELEPICVLDFYVHESRQRMGCGRRLFDYMLEVISTIQANFMSMYGRN